MSEPQLIDKEPNQFDFDDLDHTASLLLGRLWDCGSDTLLVNAEFFKREGIEPPSNDVIVKLAEQCVDLIQTIGFPCRDEHYIEVNCNGIDEFVMHNPRYEWYKQPDRMLARDIVSGFITSEQLSVFHEPDDSVAPGSKHLYMMVSGEITKRELRIAVEEYGGAFMLHKLTKNHELISDYVGLELEK